MGKIFKNMLPYRKAVIIIIALLFVQAWCDLSLPSYTSDIIDVGIQNSGVEHIVPEKLTKSEFKAAQFIMTDDEADLWKGLYKADGEFYKLKDKSSKELDEADEKLNLPLIMNYQMSTLEVSSFKKTIANQMGKKESELENDDLQNYKMKVSFYIRQHQDNPAIAKLRGNIPLTVSDIAILEDILWNELGSKEEYEKEYGAKPLGELVREIVGMDIQAAKAAFSHYLDEVQLDPRQSYFVNQVIEYIVQNGIMKDLSVLQESPFTDKGNLLELFEENTIILTKIRQSIEKININALVA